MEEEGEEEEEEKEKEEVELNTNFIDLYEISLAKTKTLYIA